MEAPGDLGRRLVRDMRQPEVAQNTEAVDMLRFGAESMDDEQVWDALLAALDEARQDSEFWALGDGFIDESVRTRPTLDRRWRKARATIPKVAEVYRVMQDPRWNWTDHGRWGE